MIYRFQPFSTTKSLGECYNAHCNLVPNPEDWIMITDYDAMVLSPKTYSVIEKAIENNPGTMLFGCMTNRIGIASQRLGNEPDENLDIGHQFKIAEKLADEFPNGDCKPAKIAAGFCMIFQKQYWQDNQFQDKVLSDRGVLFDLNFSRKAKMHNSIKIIKGAYLWHSYRLFKKNWQNKDHLK